MGKGILPLVFLVVTGIFVSCMRPEDFDMDMYADQGIDYDVAMPLTSTRLTIENLIDLKGGVFVPDDTNLLHIIYSMTPESAELLPDVTLGNTPAFGFSTSMLSYTCMKDTLFSVPFSDTVHFDMDGVAASVKTLYLSSARMAMHNVNTFKFPMRVRMEFANIKDAQGRNIVYQMEVPANTDRDTVMMMENVKVEMDHADRPYVILSGLSTVNVKRVEGDSLWHTGMLYTNAGLQDMEFRRADGHLSKTSYSIMGKMPVEGLGLERMTDIRFNEAYLIADLKVEDISAPVRLTESKVLIRNVNGSSTAVSLFPENYDIAYPGIDDDPMVKESKESSTVTDLLIDRPNLVTYEVKGDVNPENDSMLLQAIQKGSKVSMGLTCDIPLYFSADNYALRDTMEISLDNLDEDTELHYFDMKSILKNAFPLDVVFSLHFLDAEHRELFSLFHEDLVEGGKIGPAPGYHVVEPSVSRFEDVLDAAEMELARRMHYVVVDARFSTTDKVTAKFYVDGEKEGFVDVKVGVRIKIRQKGLTGF